MADTTNLLVLESPILPVLAQRRSPRAYSTQPVPADVLKQVFAAASSAASCFGEQPWRYLVGTRATSPEAYNKILSSMGEFNQVWAKSAPVLVVSIAKLHFSHDDNPNRHALHDVGQATATLAIQAAELGLQVHQMAGFSIDKVRTAFGLPAGYEPVAVFTLGYPGDPASLPDGLRDKEIAPRVRKPLAEFMFEGEWPTPATERYDQATV
ncbi:nitroreductase family protein [Hymenobacter sp. BT770]|uniref:nitroreductase family protein n=1 Tax=Hymenobacter sp. BT770 TaxID=2886942 RepID=UPI001D1018E6|nr:nitroreductase family protein [Hymenobacter sp. BT770]MCC3154674.1 nitroreductase family protein [Hymenobacter sp. BT770]MDO3416728.1 nitroreductase family protein [Hymenobacter sp. BT770]